MAQRGEELLRKPLYVFDLPPEILATLERKLEVNVHPRAIENGGGEESRKNEEEGKDGTPAKATSCALCGLSFANLQEQRNHIRSDLHGYNLKQRLRGLKPVNEAEFDKLVGELNESISGSESSDSASDNDEASEKGTPQNGNLLSSLLQKQAKLSNIGVEDLSSRSNHRTGRPPISWFKSPALPDNTSLGVYRALFTNAELEDEEHIVEIIRQRQLFPAAPKISTDDSGGVPLPSIKTNSHIFLCMVGGGHFAAMIVSLAPKISKKHTSGADERSATVLAHKTFHRYTTRRKQGGAQSSNDAAKGAAHSAGSALRRYNETALTSEIRDLLSQWKDMIDSSQLLFIRATGTTNRRTLFGPYDEQVLRQSDPRIRGFPFSTRRATQAELMRCFVELTRAKISQVDEAALAAAAATEASRATADAAAKSAQTQPSTRVVKPSKEDETASLHTTQIQALIRRSKAPGLLHYLGQHSLSADFTFHPPDTQANYHAPTPLHLAASVNSPACVLALLTKAGADPCKLNGESKPPFDLAGDRATRDAFRVARHVIGESRWNWDLAHVPSPLTKSEADERESREKQESEAAEADRRKVEMEKLKAEEARKEEERRSNNVERREKKHGKGKVLSVEKTGQERRDEEARGLTPEMRMRLERERRARAAEERIRRMHGVGGVGGGG